MKFGFHNGRSADNSLVSLAENIKSSLRNSRFRSGIPFIGLKKPMILLSMIYLFIKWKYLKIRGIALSRS